MKGFKKLLSIILVVILVFSIIPLSAITTNAVDVPLFKLVPSQSAAQVGDVISVGVTVSENSRLCGVILDVIYDTTAFEVVEAVPEYQFDTEIINPAFSNRAVRFVGSATNYISDKATTIFTIKFKVLDNCCDIDILVREAHVINDSDVNQDVTMDANIISTPITIHQSGDETVISKPTCETTGYKTYNCPCGELVEENTPATGHNYENRICTVCKKAAPKDFVSVTIKEPSRYSIRYKDGIVLHAIVEGDASNTYVKWSANNSNFKMEASDNDLTIISDRDGYTTFTVTVYQSNGKILSSYKMEMRSKANFFDKIGGFFRSLFGTDVIYDY